MTDRDRLIELIKQGNSNTPCEKDEYRSCAVTNCDACVCEGIADHLLANGVIVPPCKVGDCVWIETICGLKEDNSPIFEMKQGQVYEMRIDNGEHTKLWIGASFGILHCCRPYTDFYFTKEEAEQKLKELEK